MTDYQPYEAEPASQTVTLDDERTQCLFVKSTEPGGRTRVFYDLNALAATYLPELLMRKVEAQLSGNAKMEAQIAGAALLLRQVMVSADSLAADYEDTETLSGEGITITDIFPDA